MDTSNVKMTRPDGSVVYWVRGGMRERETKNGGVPRYRVTDCNEPGKLSGGSVTQIFTPVERYPSQPGRRPCLRPAGGQNCRAPLRPLCQKASPSCARAGGERRQS